MMTFGASPTPSYNAVIVHSLWGAMSALRSDCVKTLGLKKDVMIVENIARESRLKLDIRREISKQAVLRTIKKSSP